MPCEHNSYCSEAEYSNFPFDSTSCTFNYMSRTKNANELIFVNQSLTVDGDAGVSNRAWLLVSATGMITTTNRTNDLLKISPNSINSYSCIEMKFLIKRDSKELVYQIIIPAFVLIIITISTLMLDAEMNERWVLYAINMFSHVIYNVQLSWMLPKNSDSIPQVFIFFCDSQMICTFLMLESILMKISIKSKGESLWLHKFMSLMDKSFIGRLTTTQGIGREKLEDESSEVTEVINKAEAVLWTRFSCICDRFMIIVLIPLYGFMFLILMPKYSQSTTSNNLNFEYDY